MITLKGLPDMNDDEEWWPHRGRGASMIFFSSATPPHNIAIRSCPMSSIRDVSKRNNRDADGASENARSRQPLNRAMGRLSRKNKPAHFLHQRPTEA
jgi:hypothetical protein